MRDGLGERDQDGAGAVGQSFNWHSLAVKNVRSGMGSSTWVAGTASNVKFGEMVARARQIRKPMRRSQGHHFDAPRSNRPVVTRKGAEPSAYFLLMQY